GTFAPGCCWSKKHLVQVSWGIWCPPRCCRDGTRHGHTVRPAYPRSSFVRTRKRLCWQPHRSRSASADAECHKTNPIEDSYPWTVALHHTTLSNTFDCCF